MAIWAQRLGSVLDVILVAWVAAAVLVDGMGGRPPPRADYAYVVVAGAGVRPGGHPSDVLVARTEQGVSLFQQGWAPRLALTGGIGDWPPAESVVARNLAVGLGVPVESIVIEDRSTSTEGNAAELARRIGDVPILVVTDRYHVVRCRRVFGRYFSSVQGKGVVSPARVRAHGALREVLAFALYGVTGRL